MRGNQKNINYKIKWSPEFAYAIGLLTTDGNLSKDGRHLEFTSKDFELIQIFKKCMTLKNVKTSKKGNGDGDKRYFHIQFSNVRLYKELIKIGLTPNKSKTLKEIQIPENYFFDFLRGRFDGDGCFYYYWDKRWKSSFMFYTVFNSVSRDHILWLRKKINKTIKVKGHLCQDGEKSEWQLKYAKRESKIIIDSMYYKKNLPCLKRKYRKIKSNLEVDKESKVRRASAGIR